MESTVQHRPRQTARAPANAVVLPSAVDAEQQVVGSLLLTPELIATTTRRLRAADFVDPLHRELFGVLAEMARTREPIDVGTVLAKLKASGRNPSPAGYLAEVGAAVVTAAHSGFHADRILEASRKRQIYALATEAAADAAALNGHASSDVLNDLLVGAGDLQRELHRPEDGSSKMFASWEKSIINREAPTRFRWAPYGSRLGSLAIGEKQVVIIGAPPAGGKTILAGQIMFDALRADGQDHLKALNANVETPPQTLLDRQLARLTGIGHNFIQHRDYAAEALPRVRAGIEELRDLIPRIDFMAPPFTLERLTERVDASEASIVIVDYAQRFDFSHRSSDQRAQANAVMDCCRRLADEGRAVIVISAVNRSGYGKDAGLASFRESSELEYGADSAYLLIRDEADSSAVTLKCVKNRHGAPEDVRLRFDGAGQQFVEAAETEVVEVPWN